VVLEDLQLRARENHKRLSTGYPQDYPQQDSRNFTIQIVKRQISVLVSLDLAHPQSRQAARHQHIALHTRPATRQTSDVIMVAIMPAFLRSQPPTHAALLCGDTVNSLVAFVPPIVASIVKRILVFGCAGFGSFASAFTPLFRPEMPGPATTTQPIPLHGSPRHLPRIRTHTRQPNRRNLTLLLQTAHRRRGPFPPTAAVSPPHAPRPIPLLSRRRRDPRTRRTAYALPGRQKELESVPIRDVLDVPFVPGLVPADARRLPLPRARRVPERVQPVVWVR
jgi:hypothetical protein